MLERNLKVVLARVAKCIFEDTMFAHTNHSLPSVAMLDSEKKEKWKRITLNTTEKVLNFGQFSKQP